MKRSEIIIVIFLLQIGSFNINAQSTGFMGKRVLIGYSFNTSPAIFGATAQNETIIGTTGNAESGSLVFNAIHEGFIEVAPTSKLMVGFSVRYYKTEYDNAREFRNLNTNSYYFEYLDTHPSGYYNITGLSYTLYFRYFGSRYVAPWGRYLMFGPVINTMKTSYDPSIMKVRAYDYSTSGSGGEILVTNFGTPEQSYTGVNLMLGAGRSRIVGKRITIDYGFNTHFFSLINGVFDVTNMQFFDTFNLQHDNYIQKTVKSRVRGINRFNVFIKVGILLF